MNYEKRPVTVAATGGSGTRVIVNILQHVGFYMGVRVNEAGDSGPMEQIIHRWHERYLTRALTAAESDEMVSFFHHHVARHRLAIPDETMMWGWKNPRGIFFLPLYFQEYPELRYVHVIRDGRDLAYSRNQGQTGDFAYLLEKSERGWPIPLRCVRLWALANLALSRYARENHPDQYHCLRYEDLCDMPEETIAGLFEFLQLPGEQWDMSGAADIVQVVGNIGRFRNHPVTEVEALECVGRYALEHFGYLEKGGQS